MKKGLRWALFPVLALQYMMLELRKKPAALIIYVAYMSIVFFSHGVGSFLLLLLIHSLIVHFMFLFMKKQDSRQKNVHV